MFVLVRVTVFVIQDMWQWTLDQLDCGPCDFLGI